MPIHASTNFCRHNFDFALQMLKQGTETRCFCPGVKWFGTACLEPPGCASCFLITRCFVYQRGWIFYRIGIVPWGNATITSAMTSTTSVLLQENKHLGSVVAGWASWAQSLKYTTARLLFRWGGLPRSVFSTAMLTESDSDDKIAVKIYLDWIENKRKVPCSFHPPLFVSACLAVKKLPPELQRCIIRQCFTGRSFLRL